MRRLVIIGLCIISCHLFAQKTQLVFGGKQGAQTGAAYLGIKQSKFVITLGSDFLQVGLDGDYQYARQQNASFREQTQLSFDGSAFLVIPHLGVKYFLSDVKPIKPYVHSEVFVSFPAFKMSVTGKQETWTYNNGTESQYESQPIYFLTPPIEKAVKEALSFWGFSICFGTEFFIHDQFSIGAEYGLRYFFDQAEYKGAPLNELAAEDIDDFLYEDASLNARFHMGYSYTMFSLNFYY